MDAGIIFMNDEGTVQLRTPELRQPRPGPDPGHSSDLVLDDPQGRPRIVVKVESDGNPVLQFLDARGKVIEQLPQTSNH